MMANLFVDVHQSKATLTLFLDSNCFLIASTVRGYALWQMLFSGLADSSTDSLCYALYDSRSFTFDKSIYEM
jgi:hypothetical protein